MMSTGPMDWLDVPASSGGTDTPPQGDSPKGDRKPRGRSGGDGDKGKGKDNQPVLDAEAMAARFGYAWSAVKDEPELKDLFNWAARQLIKNPAGDLTDAFRARLMATDWYKTKSTPYLTAFKVQNDGTNTWSTILLPNATDAVLRQARDLGFNLTREQAAVVANDALFSGRANLSNGALLDTEWVQGTLAADAVNNFDRLSADPASYQDKAQGTYAALQDFATRNGVVFTPDWYRTNVLRILNPTDEWSVSDVQNQISAAAKQKFPGIADQIGTFGTSSDGQAVTMTVRDVMSPYLTRIAEKLELPYDAVKLDDPILEKVMDSQGTVNFSDLTQFVREDARWRDTAEAVDRYNGLASSMSRLMGVVS